MQTYKQVISIRISDECLISWNYLISKKVSPARYLRESGEKGVINKAKEFKQRLKLMAKDKVPIKVKIWPKLYDNTKSESTYEITITSFSELPAKEKLWKMEIIDK